MEQLEVVREKMDNFLASDFRKWLIATRDPAEIWEQHRSFLIIEVIFYFLALLTFKHAMCSGGRYRYLWFTTILHGCVVESLSYFLPDIDNFWHAQSMVMLLGKRLPLHIVLFYPVFIYTAFVSVSRMRLKAWAEPFAVGLAVVLLDVPFDIVGIKLLFWTWHDTDPNVYDRMYWVPWTSYYFHAAFASAFAVLFFGTRRVLCSSPRFDSDGFIKETLCSLVTGLLAMPLGVLLFLPLYHPLHDMLGIHTEVCVLLFLSIYFIIVWTADRHPEKEARTTPSKGWFDVISLHVFIHFITYITLISVEDPQTIQSTGLHETIGPCDEMSATHTAFGSVLEKRKYLCASNYSEGYFDFHCLSGSAPKSGDSWYTICGTALPNRIEYIIVVTAFSLLGLIVYMQMLAHSGNQIKLSRAADSKQHQTTGAMRKKKD